MIVASWNVNSVRSRLEHLLAFLKDAKPDVVCLQELKCQEEQFPFDAIKDAGYQAAVIGQKAYNGVAVLSKTPIKEHHRGLVGNEDDPQSRYLEADVDGVRVINIYAPNGNPIGTEKFTYKLRWLEFLHARMSSLLADEIPFLVTGDYNIIPEEIDAKHPDRWKKDALFQPEARAMYRRFLNLGLTDAFRHIHGREEGHYTFWDYFRQSFEHDNGIRIDHFLLSPDLADRCKNCWIDKSPRVKEKPSDHTPILLELR
ncbi:MAG TPA: exodeoxyribonuclease III [Alphaproteobacteria bacterium]